MLLHHVLNKGLELAITSFAMKRTDLGFHNIPNLFTLKESSIYCLRVKPKGHNNLGLLRTYAFVKDTSPRVKIFAGCLWQ